MATRLQLCILRCSLSGRNQNTLFARSFSNLLGQGRPFCYATNKEEKVLSGKQLITSQQCLNPANFSTVRACHRGDSRVCGDSATCKSAFIRMTSTGTVDALCRETDMIRWCQKRGMAGHSHWQNIKHIKGARDAKMANAASKTMNNILIAVKAGGGDPRFNKQLAKVVDIGLTQGLTKTRINEMVEKCVAKSQNYQKSQCFVTGPQGCVFVVEVFTDNINRFKTQLASLVKKTGGRVTKEGRENFDEKGVVEVAVTAEMEPVDMDKYLEIAIEVGAEDVILMEEENEEGNMKKVLKFHCNPLHVNGVKKEIESYDLEVSSAESDFIPLHWVTLDGAELTVAENIYQKISEHEEVTKVFDNVTTPDE